MLIRNVVIFVAVVAAAFLVQRYYGTIRWALQPNSGPSRPRGALIIAFHSPEEMVEKLQAVTTRQDLDFHYIPNEEQEASGLRCSDRAEIEAMNPQNAHRAADINRKIDRELDRIRSLPE